ncbi:MAG: GNAT family N-acetyltransferase [Patescibacteria group bacterium]
MFRRLRMHFAQKRDAKKVAQLFRELDSRLSKQDLLELIHEKRIVLLHQKNKTLGAFSFAKLGLGIFTLLFIRKLVVDKKFRGRGLGGKVLQKLRDFTRRKKALGFLLWSRRAAKNFYLKNKLKNWWRFFWWRQN